MLPKDPGLRIWAYRIGIFLGAFLLFQVQLMFSKALLPAFGGSYLVWASCMVFFQGMLLAGYAYVHGVQRRLGVVKYARWHTVLLLLPFLAFPFRFAIISGSIPTLPLAIAVPFMLLVYVGIPFFVLSTISLTYQSWFYVSDLPENKNPYMLYSASNLGSMLALLTYPIIFEPLFDLRQQGNIWWASYIVLVVISFFCMPRRGTREEISDQDEKPAKIRSGTVLRWFLLAASGCATLLAVTNLITFDIASVPFLWVLPLSVYLLTFVLVFKRDMWYPDWIKKAFAWAVPIGIILYVAGLLRLTVLAPILILVQLAILFVVCMNCHGRLVEIKPRDGSGLTTFYMILAFGGFAGSLLVSNIIPLLSRSLIEYPGSFFLSSLALVIAKNTKDELFARMPWFRLASCAILAIICFTVLPWSLENFLQMDERIIFLIIAIPIFLTLRFSSEKFSILPFVLLAVALSSQWTEELSFGSAMKEKVRNFYGIYRVYDSEGQRYLQHGTTLHGRQYLEGPKKGIPSAYYHPETSAGELLKANPFKFKNIAMIGLGTGAIAAYMEEGQKVTVYELDPDNLDIAREYFTYLDIAEKNGAELKFVFGDGRISLRDVPDGTYDLLILDAFNSGAIPVHLLTVEAVREYFRTLRPGGVLLLHISNNMLDLAPVIYGAAAELGLYASEKSNFDNIHPDADRSVWMVITKDIAKQELLIKTYGWEPKQHCRKKRPWTDQYTDLISAMF